VVMLAKHRAANRLLAGMFERGEVEKRYLAIVYGAVSADSVIDAPIAKVDARYQYPVEYEFGKANDRATYLPKRIVGEGGKDARTRVKVVGVRQHADLELSTLHVTPEQGRTNQIRVHLSHIGHPIVGDKIYALSGSLRDEVLRDGMTERVRAALILDRHALHCEGLRFVHPLTSETLTIEAPVPEDLRALASGGFA
jgi:23S rRNA pseudouridine1911/1915/1917 synthase